MNFTQTVRIHRIFVQHSINKCFTATYRIYVQLNQTKQNQKDEE